MIIQCDKDFDLHTSAALSREEAISQVPAVPAIGNICSPHVYLQDAAVCAHQVNENVVCFHHFHNPYRKKKNKINKLAHCASTSINGHNNVNDDSY
jgi:hypothetical protein